MALPPTQQRIKIKDVQDGVIILDDDMLRAILMVSSLNFNFALESTASQEGLISGYQNFLNSLDFPIEILAVSRRLRIEEYLALIAQKRKEQPSELLRVQLDEYRDFIKSLLQMSEIMNQFFYVVIPLARIEKKSGGLVEKLGLMKNLKSGANQEALTLEELKTQLWQRVEYVRSGLSAFGINSAALNNDEITQLFYQAYNMGSKEIIAAPGASEPQK